MRCRDAASRDAGFTLMELAVVLSILTLLSGVVSSFFLTRHGMLLRQNAQYEMQQEQAQARWSIARDIRSAASIREMPDGFSLRLARPGGACVEVSYVRAASGQLVRRVRGTTPEATGRVQDEEVVAHGVRSVTLFSSDWPLVRVQIEQATTQGDHPISRTSTAVSVSQVRRGEQCLP